MSKNKDRDNPFKGNYDSLEEFADHISDVLKCPITIEDATHRLIAYSTHDDRTDPARISTIIGRRVPEKVINSLWKDNIIPALLKTVEPIRVRNIDEVGLGNRVAISIWKDKHVLGFIWALEVDKSLSEQDLELLKNAAKVAKNKLLQLHIRKNKKEERYQEFFWKLLTGHITSTEEIEENFRYLQIVTPATFAIVVFTFKEEIKGEFERQISYILKITQKIQPLLFIIDYNQLILMASPGLSKQPLKELNDFIIGFISQMKVRFGVDSIKGSCGTIYDTFEKVEKSYKEALTVLPIKERFTEETKSIYNYQELGIYQFFDLLLEKRQNDRFENYSLKMLEEYDQKHKSNLVETLETYLNKDNNINTAAKELHIHTNTLNYRLKRISEIGKINLHDPNQKMTIYIDIKLNKYRR